MSKPRFQVEVTFDTLAHAEQVRDWLVQQLVGEDVFEQHSLNVGVDDLGGQVPTLTADWRFNAGADRDALVTMVKDRVSNHPQVKGWVQSAKLSSHRCTHDDSVVQNCRTTDYMEWSRA